jgi:hypothetical protein
MDASLMAVDFLTWHFVNLRYHGIDARQAIGLSDMAEDFCSSSATTFVANGWC